VKRTKVGIVPSITEVLVLLIVLKNLSPEMITFVHER